MLCVVTVWRLTYAVFHCNGRALRHTLYVNNVTALGLDAFSLTYLINQLTLLPEFGVMDATGVLFLNSENQIMRELQWAKFEGGVPQRLLQRKALP